MNSNTGERLYRSNIMLGDEDSRWLDQLAAEIHTATGAKVSRSEIVRASIAGLRELHRLAPECPSRFVPLATCNGTLLAQMIVLAVRWAMLVAESCDTGSRAPRTSPALETGRVADVRRREGV